MDAESITKTLSVTGSQDETRNKVTAYVSQSKGKLRVNNSDYLEITYGSELMTRLFGLALTGIKAYPRKVVVRLRPLDSQTEVTLEVKSNVSFGSSAGFGNKVKTLFEQDLAGFVNYIHGG